MRISLTSIPVDSPVKAHQFYTEVLGFVSRVFMPEANLAIVASPEEPAGVGLLLEPNDDAAYKALQSMAYQRGMPIIVFGVDDIAAEYERLRGRGVIFSQPPTQQDFGTTALFDDTCGNYIQLHQA